MESLAVRVTACPRADVEGVWQRHVAARYALQALDGRRGTGRWSTKDGFPVLYLGRPTNSVIVEAYRHLVDPVEDENIVAQLEPRALVTCTVNLTNSTLHSATSDRAAYARCQAVAQVAHQIGLHGIIAPAATELGDTLALFTDMLPADERPTRSEPDTVWNRLPADPRSAPPRHLRVIDGRP